MHRCFLICSEDYIRRFMFHFVFGCFNLRCIPHFCFVFFLLESHVYLTQQEVVYFTYTLLNTKCYLGLIQVLWLHSKIGSLCELSISMAGSSPCRGLRGLSLSGDIPSTLLTHFPKLNILWASILPSTFHLQHVHMFICIEMLLCVTCPLLTIIIWICT